MPKSSLLRRWRRLFANAGLSVFLAIIASAANAATTTITLGFDTDNNAATGCTLVVGGQSLSGIEVALDTVVNTSTATGTVGTITRRSCASGTFGAPTTVSIGGWPVGMTTGTGGSDLIESFIPIANLPGATLVKIGAITAGDGIIATQLLDLGAAPPQGPTAAPIPTLLPVGLGVLLLLIVGTVWLLQRYARNGGQTLFVLCLFALALTTVSAWAIVRDGNGADWAGIAPIGTDPLGDAAAGEDLVALFAIKDGANVSLRVDAVLARDAAGNLAPVVSAGANQTITLPAGATLAGTATDDGLPNPPGALTLAWSKFSGPGAVTFGNAALAATNATFSAAGIYVLRLSAYDGALTGTADVTVTVNPGGGGGTNQPPTVNAGANQTITLPASATLAGTATDDGLPNPPGALSINWSLDSGPASVVTFGNAAVAGTTATFAAPGTYTMRLTANDGALTASSTVQITVIDGAPQLAAIADRTINVGERLQVLLDATDGNANDVLAYALTSAPAGATLNPAPLIDWVPTAAQLGTHSFTAKVTDSGGKSATATFNVTVVHTNHAPQLAPQASQTLGVGTPFARTLSATDPDAGDVLTYALVAGPNGMVRNGANLTWATTGMAPGDYAVTVKVTDSGGLSDQRSFTLTLQASAAPVAVDDRYTVKPGATLTIAAPGVLANDVDASGNGMTATKVTDPTKGTLSAFNANGSFTFVAPGSVPAQPSLKANPLWGALNSGITGYPQSADINHDGGADVVVISYGTPEAYDGKTGATLWSSWDRSATSLGRNCETYLVATDFALGDVDGSGNILYVAGSNCEVHTAGAATRIIGVDTDPAHAVGGAAAVKWVSERLDVQVPLPPSVGAPPVPTYLLNPLGDGLASYATPTLAKLTPGGSTKVLTRYLIGTGMFPYDSDGDGTRESWASCYAATGNIADNGKGCGVTFVLDAATGVKELVLTAPNPYNQYESAERTPYRQLPPVVADLDGDGQVEIISGTDVFKYDGTKWSLAWQAGLPGVTIFYEPFSVSVADLDGDGTAEVVLHAAWYDSTGYHRGFLTYRHDGVLLHRFEVPMWDTGPVTIADIDGDGIPEILLVGRGLVWAYKADGTLVWASAIPDDDAALHPDDDPSLRHSPAAIGERTGAGNGLQVYDLDHDGRPEVIASGLYRMAIYDGRTGAIKSSMHNNALVRTNNVPLVVDANGDGHAEVVSAAGSPGICAGCASSNILAFSGVDRNWAPAPLVQNQVNFNQWAVNNSGGILYDGGVHRSFRTQRQLGKVVDPRTLDTATFTYAAVGDGGASAPATVSVQVMPQNSPPVITSTPPTALYAFPNGQGQYPTFVYQIAATDPDVGDTVHYEFVYSTVNTAYFAQATVDPVTGVVRMYTGPCGGGGCDFGLMTFIVAAVDSFGARTEQGFVIDVTTQPRTVPAVVGQLQQPAKDAVEAVQLIPRVVEVFDARPVGRVVAQDPAAGTVVARSTTVLLSVSKGLQPIAMPFVVGKQLAQAKAILTNVGLSSNISTTFSATIPAGEVMTQSPAFGTLLDPANAPPVDLLVSAGGALPAPIASIVLVPGPGPLARLANTNEQFKAVAILTDGTSADVTLKAAWSTTNATAATVDGTGLVKAKVGGSATIAATLSGKTGQVIVNVSSLVPGDNTPPVATITAPADGSDIIGPVPIVGTASDANFLRYELAISPAGDDTWTLLSEGTTVVTNGTLGTLDPTTLLNDLYTLRLTVFDKGENVSMAEATVQVKGDRKVGLFSLTYSDLSMPAAGIPVIVTRTYDSRDKAKGDFGIGWRQGFNTLRLRTNRVLGTGWVRIVTGPVVTLAPMSEHKVSVTLADGRVEEFDMTVSPNSNIGSLDFTNVTGFQPRPGTLGTLQAVANSSLLIVNAGATVELVDDNTLNTYDPQRYRYTTIDGTQYEIGPRTGVTKVTDANGNSVAFGRDGIIHSSGKNVVFTRDVQGRIIAITDPMGNVRTYAYDGNGDLVTYVNPVNGRSGYAYDRNHGLIEIRDANGVQAVRNEYDDSGRLVAVIDANGNRVAFSHDDAAQEEVITDRRGNVRRLRYDVDGNVLSREQGVTINGAVVNAVTTTTYDALGNATSGVDPDGRRVDATYSGIKPLTQIADPGGLALTKTFAYNARNDVTAVTDPGGRNYAFVYDGSGNITSYDTPLAGAATSVSNAQGQAVQFTDALGNKTLYTRNAGGLVIREEVLDAASALLRRSDFTYNAVGNRTSVVAYRTVGGVLTPFTTQFEYDAANRPTSVTDAAGGITRVEYDATGRVTARIDALGRRTVFAFDSIGQAIRTTYPDGTFETTTYDADGNAATRTDRAGRTTTFTYDELNRVVRTTGPDGTSTETIFTAGGIVAATIDGRGNRTDFTYDTAGRPTKTTLPAVVRGVAGPTVRPVVARTLNALGTVNTETDPEGRTTTFAYDASGRPAQTTFADGANVKQTLDAMGRRTSIINEEGQATNFSYDGLSRLTAVSGLAGDASYVYDESGNLIAQTDALGRTTRYRYDALNRGIETKYPDGATETFVFDAVGNRVVAIDPNGRTTTFVYDAMDRLTRRTSPGGLTVDIVYTPDGQRSSVTDARGVTSYAYDGNGRMAGITFPGGATLGYTRDANGNLLSLSAPAGSQDYGYDALNRLTQTTTPEGASQNYYDLAGNRLRAWAANGLVTDATFDARNRPLNLTHQTGGGTVLESFGNAYSPAGRRTRVTEFDGSVENYAYDTRGRLISQSRTGSTALAITHSYDAVGNRTQMVRNGASTNFTYNGNDQLTSDGVNTYAYDANGNLVSSTGGGSSKVFVYDTGNRLAMVSGAGGVIQYVYDADGNRVETQTSTGVTRYLVDEANNTGLSQVLEERDGAGSVQARYSYGTELLAMSRGAQSHFYQRDAHGNVRSLSDPAGTLSDRYQYEAYGATVSASGSTENPYRYGGERLDADTGLYQLRARYYNPALGRFVSRDPFAGQPSAPVSRHRYLYANADPVDNSDPTGLTTLTEEAFVGWLNSTIDVATTFRGVRAACAGISTLEQINEILFYTGIGFDLAIASAAIASNYDFGAGGGYKSIKFGPTGEIPLIDRTRYPTPVGDIDRVQIGLSGGQGKIGVKGAFHRAGVAGQIEVGFSGPPPELKGGVGFKGAGATLKRFTFCGMPASKDPNVISNFASIVLEPNFKVYGYLGAAGQYAYGYRAQSGIGASISLDLKFNLLNDHFKATLPLMGGDFSGKGVNLYLGGAIGGL